MVILITYVEVKDGFPTLSYWKLPKPKTDDEFEFIKSMNGFVINETDPYKSGYASAIAFQGAIKNCSKSFYDTMIKNLELPKNFHSFEISKYGIYKKFEFKGGHIPSDSYIITLGYIVSEL